MAEFKKTTKTYDKKNFTREDAAEGAKTQLALGAVSCKVTEEEDQWVLRCRWEVL